MNKTKILFVLVTITFAMTTCLIAQSPDKFNYQAVYRDASGNPVINTSVTVDIYIRLNTVDGTIVYEETHTPTTNDYGYISIVIGEGDAVQNLSDVDWSAGAFYMQVDINGTELSNTQLISVPYSKYADEAGNGVTSSQVTNWNTAYSWGDHELMNYLTAETDPVFGSSAASSISSTNISNWNTAYSWGNHATAGYSPLTNDFTRYNDTIYYIDGNVGIGTKDPRSTLSVYGTTPNDSAIFEVKNNDGYTVFAVYNEGVRVYIDEQYAAKGPKGGFAIGGFDRAKGYGPVQDYLRVTGDSTRIYINKNATKGPKGGFAIGGFDGTKSYENFVSLTPSNSLIGPSAGANLLSGSNNFFAGYEAGMMNETGNSNVLIGPGAGKNNDSNANVFIGVNAGYSNSTAFGSVIIGDNAGYDNNGFRNVIIGRYAGENNSTGGNNVYIGNDAASTLETGSDNTIIGGEAGDFAEGGSRNVYLGRRAAYDNNGDDNVIIGDRAGANNEDYGNPSTTYSDNVFIGASSGIKTTSGNQNVFIGMYSGRNNTLGTGNVYIGYQAGQVETEANNRLIIANNSTTSPLVEGTFSPFSLGNQVLKINGKLQVTEMATGSGTDVYIDSNGELIKLTSSKRYKSEIVPFTDTENVFMRLKPVSFIWNELTATPGIKDYGLIAEEVAEISPVLAEFNKNGDAEAVNYHKINMLTLKTVQDQQKKISELERELQIKEQQIEYIMERLNAIESSIR